MPTITEFSVSDHGIANAQYFQGAGVAFTKYEYCATGCGNNLAEAIEDALDLMAQADECSGVDFDLFKTRVLNEEFNQAREWPESDSVPEDADETYYYVTIKYNVAPDAVFTDAPFNEYGHFTGIIPDECARDCSASGSVDDAVEHWRAKLNFTVPRDKAIAWLRETGAWPLETNKYATGLNDESDETLARRVLWLACCEIRESGTWYGLTN